MIFNSIQYLIFLPLVVLLYYFLPVKFRWLLLLIASCYFYMFFIPVYILILGFTILVDYVAGIMIENAPKENKKKFLYLSLFANIGVLCVFKYYNFFIENIEHLLSTLHFTTYKFPYLSILLPIGLSFHTFQAMSYTLEIYRGKQKAERHFGIYALYVMFFPQLVAGPIERPQHILPQFDFRQRFEWSNVVSGLRFILLGLFKKVAIADQLNVMVSYVFDNPQNSQGFSIYLGCLLFAMQVYCDFSGYSDIARGSAKLFGIDLVENFKLPFFSYSFASLWSKWHMSLMSWFRDYIYIPLGGNRTSKLIWYRNLAIIFLLSGFWHGANWTYILWGVYSGLLLIYTKATAPFRSSLLDKMGFTKTNKVRLFIQCICVFHIFSFGLIFFRPQSIADSFLLIRNMFSGFSESISNIIINKDSIRNQALYLGKDAILFGMILFFVFLLELFEWKLRNNTLDQYLNSSTLFKRFSIYVFVVFSIILLSNIEQTPFIYFQF